MGEKVLTFLGRGEVWVAGSALVVFLILTWVLRGAPPGQAAESEHDVEAPRAGWAEGVRFSSVLYQIQSLGMGQFDLRFLALHLSVCVFVLTLTVKVLEARANR